MKFSTRLYMGFGFLLLLMTILLVVNMNISNGQNKEMNEIVQTRYERIKLLSGIGENAFYLYADLAGDIKTLSGTGYVPINDRIRDLEMNINRLVEFSPNEPENGQVAILKSKSEDFTKQVGEILLKRNLGQTENEASELLVAETLKNTILTYSQSMISDQEIAMDDILAEAGDRLETTVQTGVVSIVLGVLFGIALSYWSITKISKRLRTVKEVMSSVKNGIEELPRIDIVSHDEIGKIAVAYNEMAASLEAHEKKERQYKERMEEQNWLKTKITELAHLTQNAHDIYGLGKNYLSSLATMLQANYGVIYLKEEKDDRPYLLKLASYGADDARNEIHMGENLAGQCLEDGKMIDLQNFSNHQIKVSTGLSETKVNHLIIIPIKLNGEILAVLELAKIDEFTLPYKDLLRRVMEQLGFVINRIQKQMEVKALLAQTQDLNEELQDQSEELQLQQEELRTMNEELEAQYKQSEQRFEELQEAKSALEETTKQVLLGSQYKSEFLANMSHELRTPLNSLLILAQILVENKEGNLTSKQRAYANTIFSAGTDLLELINEILDLAKIESGKVDLQLSKINIKGIVNLVKNQFYPIAEQKGLLYEVEVDSSVPSYIHSDEQKIYQVLKNFISNALKFTEKGKVSLKVSRPKIGGQDCVAFSVRDTGIGIPEDKKSLIFEAFQQADGTTSRKYGGTGLGLSISKGVADLLGGHITVDSQEGIGSTFTFYLPIGAEEITNNSDQEVAAALDEKSSSDERVSENENNPIHQLLSEKVRDQDQILEGNHILIVDDDMRNVYALTVALEEVGLNVRFAENGKEALNILNEKPDIDLVLMDIMMPELDGYETIKAIRTMEEFKRLPVIALTAKAMKEDRQKCIDAGASDYISKPVNLEKLLSLLKVWLYK